MARKIGGILVTGAAGNGKTTYIQLLECLLQPPRSEQLVVAKIDTSRILFRWGIAQTGELGQKIRDSRSIAAEGKYVPDSIFIPAFEKWYTEIVSQCPNLRLLLIAGAPRTSEQLRLLKLFENVLVTNIQICQKKSGDAIMERLSKSTEARIDDAGGEEIVTARWNEHVTQTLPMMDKIKRNGIHLDRKDPLSARLSKTLQHLKGLGDKSPVPARILNRAIERLYTPTHPVHAMIREIEHPSAVPSERNHRPSIPVPVVHAAHQQVVGQTRAMAL